MDSRQIGLFCNFQMIFSKSILDVGSCKEPLANELYIISLCCLLLSELAVLAMP